MQVLKPDDKALAAAYLSSLRGPYLKTEQIHLLTGEHLRVSPLMWSYATPVAVAVAVA